MTTHSMEEVDALANRVGIIASKLLGKCMVRGRGRVIILATIVLFPSSGFRCLPDVASLCYQSWIWHRDPAALHRPHPGRHQAPLRPSRHLSLDNMTATDAQPSAPPRRSSRALRRTRCTSTPPTCSRSSRTSKRGGLAMRKSRWTRSRASRCRGCARTSSTRSSARYVRLSAISGWGT